MKIGVCKECFGYVELMPIYETENKEYSQEAVYECPTCDYPNGIKCGDFHEIFEE